MRLKVKQDCGNHLREGMVAVEIPCMLVQGRSVQIRSAWHVLSDSDLGEADPVFQFKQRCLYTK